MSFARLASRSLSLLLLASACGGSPSDGADGSDAPAAGGSTATGGSASGGSNATGGQVATGGATTTGGAPTGGAPMSGGAPTTGGSTATGGSGPSGDGWEEVRCWRYQDTNAEFCYARLGNLWTPVSHVCSRAGDVKGPMNRNQAQCGAADEPTGWDETWCASGTCYGRLGDWLTDLRGGCELRDGEPLTETPAEARCEAAAEAPTGWDDVACFLDTSIDYPFCYGFRGIYQPTNGLYPTCEIETRVAVDPDLAEIPADAGFCD